VARKVEELLERGRRPKNGKRGEIHGIQTLASAGKGFPELLMAPPAPETKSLQLHSPKAVEDDLDPCLP